VERLPLTVKIYNGTELGIWHNGKRESDPNTVTFATFQTLWDYVIDNFPLVVFKNVKHLQYMGQEKIDGNVFDKIKFRVERRGLSVLPHNWYLIYINSGTGLIEQVLCEIGISEFRGLIQMIKFEEFTTIDGIKTPQLIRVFPSDYEGSRTGPILVGIIRDKISFRRPIADTLFDFSSHTFLE
jgi:hypothetical protein